MSVASAHRSINNLVDCGLILPINKIKASRKLGPKATLYGVESATEKEIQQALSRYLKSNTKYYSHVERLYQRTLYEIKDEEIQFSKIFNVIKNNGGSFGYHISDIAEEIAYRLHNEHKIKVWR